MMRILAGLMLMTGCAMFTREQAENYPMSYDQTFLVVATALDKMQGWQLSETDVIEGEIKIAKTGWLMPQTKQRVIVRKTEPFLTTVTVYETPLTPLARTIFKVINQSMADRPLTYPS
jgi:hypothetical protein